MSSRFGNCDQVWTCSTGHDDASSGWTLEWVAVVKSHDCLHSVKIQPGGLFGAVGGGDRGWRGEQGPCVQFSPSMRLRLRPRWGWIPCCSACLEAETTWTLLRCPWSSSPALLPKKWPADTSGGSQKHLHTAQGRGLTAMTEDEQAYSVSQQVGWRRRLKGKTSNYVSKRMDRHYCPVACHSTGCIAIKHCGPTQTQRPEDGWEQL